MGEAECRDYDPIRLRGFRWRGSDTLSTWRTDTCRQGRLCVACVERPTPEAPKATWNGFGVRVNNAGTEHALSLSRLNANGPDRPEFDVLNSRRPRERWRAETGTGTMSQHTNAIQGVVTQPGYTTVSDLSEPV
jgi:hypothetical protein